MHQESYYNYNEEPSHHESLIFLQELRYSFRWSFVWFLSL